MNDEIVVPIDITAEEKEILAILSKRQFMIIFPTLILSMLFFIYGRIPFMDGTLLWVVKGIVLFLSLTAAILLAFIKSEKYGQFLSDIIVCKVIFIRSTKIYRHL